MVPPLLNMLRLETEAPISAGRIVDWQSADCKLAEREKVPLLEIRLDHAIHPTTEDRFAFGISVVPLEDGSSALVLRLQCGASQFCWLAHPNDPELMHLVEAWGVAGCCAFILSGETSFAVALDFGPMDEELKGLRLNSGTFDAGKFADAAFELVALRLLEVTATSHIAAVPNLARVQVCVLATSAVLKARPLTGLMPGSSSRH
jgi:hypothetical protein